MWEEAVMAYFRVIFWNLPEGNEDNHKKLQSK
jgi:hypothetical protein